MRMRFGICLGVLLLTLSCCFSSHASTQQTTLKGRTWDSWANYFTASKLPSVSGDQKYTFVLLRSGMTIPKHASYEGDQYYKTKWSLRRGGCTKRGLRLVHVVGESLRYRYNDKLLDIGAKRGSAWSQDEILITTSTSQSSAMANALLQGFFPLWRKFSPARFKNTVQLQNSFDGDENVKSVQKCHYWTQLQSLFNSPTSELSLENDFRTSCSRKLHQFAKDRVRSSWAIDSPLGIHRLFEMILFESAQYSQPLDWAKTQLPALEQCVVDYFTSFFKAKDMMDLYLEKMLTKMEYEGNKIKLHMHLTDELMFLAMSYYTRNLAVWEGGTGFARVPWPKYGDALVFDFYSRSVQITVFSRLTDAKAPGFDRNNLYDPSRLFQIIGKTPPPYSRCEQEPRLYSGWTYIAREQVFTERRDCYSQTKYEEEVSDFSRSLFAKRVYKGVPPRAESPQRVVSQKDLQRTNSGHYLYNLSERELSNLHYCNHDELSSYQGQKVILMWWQSRGCYLVFRTDEGKDQWLKEHPGDELISFIRRQD